MVADRTILIPKNHVCTHGDPCPLAGEEARVIGPAPNPEYLLVETRATSKRCPYSVGQDVQCAIRTQNILAQGLRG